MKYTQAVQIILICIIYFLPNNAFSQNLKNREDYRRLDSLNKVYQRTPDSLLIYAQKLLDYSTRNNFEDGKKSAYRSLGFANSRLRNYSQSIKYYHEALKLAKSSEDKRLQYIIYNDLSITYRITKFYDSAIYYSRKLLKHYEVTNEVPLLNMTYMNLSFAYFSDSKLDSTQYYLEKSIDGFNKINDVQSLANCLSLMAEVYYQKSDFQESLKWADSSKGLIENNKLNRNYMRIYGLLGRIHKALGNENDYNYYVNKEKEFIPKNLDLKEFRFDESNEKHNKSIYKYNQEIQENLEKDKVFYKSNLFRVLTLVILLIVIIFIFFKRNEKKRKELKLLREKLNALVNEVVTNDPLDLIHLKSGVVVNINELLYIKSDGHYLEFYIDGKDKPEIDRNTMTNILKTLSPKLFVRIHKSYIVNISFIKIINSTKLMLKNGTWINLSRTYKQQLKQILNAG